VFVALAQELRTPMTSIAGFVDLLLNETVGSVGARQRNFLQRIKANTERMEVLLEQLVEVSGAVEEATPAPPHTTDIADVIDTAVHAVITQIREKQLRLEVDVDPALPPLPVQPDALRRILVHLLDNACRASRENGRVAIRAQAETLVTADNGESAGQRGEEIPFIHLAVSDSGAGIAADDRPHVFAPRYQADRALIPGLGDTGAGLASARSLTRTHGGRIWVESEMGKGSTFSLLFPIQLDAETAEQAPLSPDVTAEAG
jgi:signal transduction histidine kinase